MTESQDIVLHAKKWPLVLLVLGNLFQAALVIFEVADMNDRLGAVEAYLENDKVRHEAQEVGIKRYYDKTLPKIERDAAEMKAELAALRAEVRGLRELIAELRKDLRDRTRR